MENGKWKNINITLWFGTHIINLKLIFLTDKERL